MKRTPIQQYQSSLRRKPAKSESTLQAAVVTWCRGLGAGMVKGRFLSVPNGWFAFGGIKERAMASNKLRREGMLPGAPDLIFWGRGGRVLWIEMKLGTSGRLTPDQKAIHDMLHEDGHTVVVARYFIDAVNAITAFYRPVEAVKQH